MAKTSRTEEVLLTGARWLVGGAVILSPWLYGSADGWAWLFLCILTGLGASLWLLSVAASRQPRFFAQRLLLGWLALLAVVVCQLLPLSPQLLETLQPRSTEMVGRSDEIRTTLGADVLPPRDAAAGVRPLRTLTTCPGATVRALFLLIAYASVFLVLANAARDWGQIRRLAVAMTVSAFLLAGFGVIQKLADAKAIYWFHVPRYGGEFFGPFSNRNHYAAHLNMLFGVALGVFLSSRSMQSSTTWSDWRERIAWLSSRGASGMALTAFAVVAIGAAACASLSRGAILSLVTAVTAMGVLLGFRRGTPTRARAGLLAISALLLAGVLWIGSESLTRRIGSLAEVAVNPRADYRTIVTLDTLRMFQSFPIFGCGFGAFRHVFPIFQTPTVSLRWLHAHNDWAQLLAEGGAVATAVFLLLVAGFVGYLRVRLPGASRRARLFVAGLSVGLATVALHSFVDYGLHKPANALLLAAMGGLAVAAVHLRHHQAAPPRLGAREYGAPGDEVPVAGYLGTRLAALGALAVLTILIAVQGREWRGETAVSRFLFLRNASFSVGTNDELQRLVTAACEDAELVRTLGSRNPDALNEIAGYLLDWSGERRLEREFRTPLAVRALRMAQEAATAAPSDYLSWLWLARALSALQRWDEAETALERSRELVRHPEQVRRFAPPVRAKTATEP
jgi:O-antigen ligase